MVKDGEDLHGLQKDDLEKFRLDILRCENIASFKQSVLLLASCASVFKRFVKCSIIMRFKWSCKKNNAPMIVPFCQIPKVKSTTTSSTPVF